MSTFIIYAPPKISERDFDSFLDTANLTEPWSFTVEDFLDDCEHVPPVAACHRQTTLATDEPGRWRDVLFEPGDVVEIRCLPPRAVVESQKPLRCLHWRTTSRHGVERWIFAVEVEEIVNGLAAINAGATTWWGVGDRTKKRWSNITQVQGVPFNIYASPNPRIAKGCSKSGGVLLARCLFADLDTMTVEMALAKLALAGLPMPTMIVVSGHGVHFYWRLVVPITDLALWTAYQNRLIQLLDSDKAVHDPARVMRIPGFSNANKNAPCYIHEADPGRRYDLADIEPHLPLLLTTPKRPESKLPTRRLSVVGEGSSPIPDSNRAGVLRRASAYADRFDAAGNGERNSKLFARTCNLVEKFDLAPDEALALGKKINAESDGPLDDGEVEEVVGKAVAHIDKKGGPKGTLHHKHVRVEPYQEPQGEAVPLDAWREQMRQARIDSLKQPGIYLDSSTTGAGKTTADIEAMKKAGTSLTVLPTHDACNELVRTLAGHGLKAAAHPPLDESTCQQFGTTKNPGPARLAQRAGLNVGESVCPECRHFKNCDYQKRRDAARNADHTAATHARASNSDFHAAEGKAVVFVHEDPLDLFRPMVKVVRQSPKADVPQARHLREIADLAVVAEDIARSWQDGRLVVFAQNLACAAKMLADRLESDDLIGSFNQAAQAGLPTKVLPTVEAVPLPVVKEDTRYDDLLESVTGFAAPASAPGSGLRPPNTDALLFNATERTGLLPNGPAMNLAVAFTCGELKHLCAVIDSVMVGGKPRHQKALIGVWTVHPPDNCVVWLENAHTDPGHLSGIVGQAVIDRTPQGRLEYQVPPVQYADQDVTQQTSGGTVRGLLRKVLSLYSDARKVGVITHKSQLPELDKLDALWSKRIVKREYYHSGKDRASNAWLGCDLIVVLGTPRVPPVAVRDGLLRLGRMEAAAGDGDFGTVRWEGRTVAGKMVWNDGRGYGDPSWAEMQNLLVREALLQAVGRGRGVISGGVPVVVVSNEPLGLPLADNPLDPVTDTQDETYRLVVRLTAQIAKENNIAGRAVMTLQVAQSSPYKERYVRQLLSSLSFHGLLSRKGARGGWLCNTRNGNVQPN
jgi:hypothetical protein